jgi:hypothetical protein
MRVLLLVDLQDDRAPSRVEHEVGVRVGGLGLQAAALEGQVVLVGELKARVREELVDLELLEFCYGFGVVAVEGSYVLKEPPRVAEPPTVASLANVGVTIAARRSLLLVRADAAAIALDAIATTFVVRAEILATAIFAITPLFSMRAVARATAVFAGKAVYAMRADAAASALFAFGAMLAVIADAGAAAIFALGA